MDSPKTPRPSGITLSRSPSPSQTGSPSLLHQTKQFGKAVVHAVVETERDKQDKLHDEMQATKNMAVHAYESTSAEVRNVAGAYTKEETIDRALPKVKEGEGEPPAILYSHSLWMLPSIIYI